MESHNQKIFSCLQRIASPSRWTAASFYAPWIACFGTRPALTHAVNWISSLTLVFSVDTKRDTAKQWLLYVTHKDWHICHICIEVDNYNRTCITRMLKPVSLASCSLRLIMVFFCKWIETLHYGFCPSEKLTFKDLAKLTAFAAIFKTKSYFRWDSWGSLFIQFHFFSHIRFSLHIFLSFNYFR